MRVPLISYENRVLFVLTLTFGVVFFDRNAINYLAPFIASDLSLSNTQVGILISALSFTWALSSYFFGTLADRTGKRKTFLLLSVIAFSLCSVGSGLAGSFVALLAARLLMGLAEGPVLPISGAILAANTSEHRRGFNMGMLVNFGSNLLGSFAAPLAMVALASYYDWQMAFFIAAIPGLLVALLLHKVLRNSENVPPPCATLKSDTPALRALLSSRNTVVCMAISFFMVSWMVIGWAFLPLFYLKVRGFNSHEMGLLMSVLGASATLFSFTVPALSDRIGRKPVMVFFSALGLFTPLAALYFTGPFWGLCVLLFIGWSASGVFPLFMATIPAETVSTSHIAAAIALVVGFGEVAGGVLSPLLGGWLADLYSQATPLYVQGLFTLIAAGLSFALVETAPIKNAARTSSHAY